MIQVKRLHIFLIHLNDDWKIHTLAGAVVKLLTNNVTLRYLSQCSHFYMHAGNIKLDVTNGPHVHLTITFNLQKVFDSLHLSQSINMI
jgi:hypothetical protein